MEKTEPFLLDDASAPSYRIKEITDALEKGIQELFESERYLHYLKIMSRFHNYSANNALLIAIQKPDATYVAGYRAWEKDFGRHVKKGETGIRILAPAPYKIHKDIDKVDPQTQKPVIGKNGQPLKERVQVIIPAYKSVTVFDVSQTEGPELPEIANDLTEDVEGYRFFMEALKEISPAPIETRSLEKDLHGYYHLKDKIIVIQEGMSQQQTLKTCIHEITHAILHDKDYGKEKNAILDFYTREVQAESVAYTVCQHFGIDTSEYSFGYVAGWSRSKELEELKASINIIQSTAADMINSIEKVLCQSKERLPAKIEEKSKSMAEAKSRPKIDEPRRNVHGRHR